MQYHKQVQLNNGELCILRSPNSEDAQAILHHMMATSCETDNMLSYCDEITKTVEEEKEYLGRIEASANEIMISASVAGKIVANAGLNPVSEREKCRHRCQFGVSILKEYWGLGIGSHIMTAILEAARQAGYKQIELDVVTENDRAVALYKKFGFQIFGTHEKAYYSRSGRYQALYLMSCEL